MKLEWINLRTLWFQLVYCKVRHYIILKYQRPHLHQCTCVAV